MRRTGRSAAAALTATATVLLVLTGCGGEDAQGSSTAGLTSEPDIRSPGDLTDPYTGPYTRDFHDDVQAYAGQEVSVVADVGDVFGPQVFTILSPDDPAVPPLLVVSDQPVPDLAPGLSVEVAATPVHELEDGAEPTAVTLDDQVRSRFDGEPYLDASNVVPTAAISGSASASATVSASVSVSPTS